MDEVEKILYSMGYFDSDPHKRAEVGGFIREAEEFMSEAGVPADKMTAQSAYAVKSLWADARDKGEADSLIKRDGLIVHLIAQMRYVKRGGRG
ncbi:MAG: hypothetical protein LBL66_04810 [Clostridiales bacterium]|jgi:hypothetical protein|nr:hypothetical protein [Clostridiales bacterium]